MSSPRKRDRVGKKANDDGSKRSKQQQQTEDATMQDMDAQTAKIDLQRLLKAMEESPGGSSWHEIQSRATLCRTLWETCSSSSAALQPRVEAACARAAQLVQELQANETPGGDPVQRLFSSSSTATATETTPIAAAASTGAVTTTAATKKVPPPSPATISPPTTNVADLQKQQREQMEAAVSQMALQMKEQTSQLHSTLKSQTDHLLDSVQDVTAQNVHDMTQVAEATKSQVRKNWRRTAATWTLFLTIVAAFVGTLVTIQVIPKAKLPCMFFCSPQDNQFCRMVNGVQECIAAPEQKSNSEQEQVVVDTPLIPEDVHDVQEEESVPDLVEVEEDSDDEEDAESYQNIQQEQVQQVQEEAPQETREQQEETFPEEQQAPKQELVIPPATATYRALSRAASAGNREVMRYHLNKKPGFVYTQDANGWGLLHEAARYGHVEVLEMLVYYGANLRMTTFSGETALDLAEMELQDPAHPAIVYLKRVMNPEEVQEVVEPLAEEPPPQQVQDNTQEETVQVDPMGDIQVPLDANALREAALREFAEMQATSSSGSTGGGGSLKENQNNNNAMGGNPFGEEAATIPDSDILVFDGKPFGGKELRRAASQGDVYKLTGYLAKKPSFLNDTDQNGWTALHLAVRAGHTEAVELLLKAGARLDLVTLQGRTVMDMAILKFGNEPHPVIDMLEEYE